MIKEYLSTIKRIKAPLAALVLGLAAIDGMAYLAYSPTIKQSDPYRPSIRQSVPVIEEIRKEQDENDTNEDTPNNDNYIEERDISDEGLMLVKQFEGFKSKVYNDCAGKKTIGYGHLVKEGEKFKFLTHNTAEKLLRKDISKADRCVDDYVEVPLTQNQHDALVSFAYNSGVGGFEKSLLLEKLNSGDYAGAADEINNWIYVTAKDKNGKKVKKVSAGLVNRRERESRLFSSG